MQAMGEDEHCEKNKQLWKRSPVERFFCLGTLLGEKAFFLAAVFAAAWSCRGRRDGRFLPAFSGPPPFPFALFWDTGGRLGIFFLFYHSFAQCVDLLIPLFLLGITAFGVFAVPLFLFFRGITVESASFIFCGGTSCGEFSYRH